MEIITIEELFSDVGVKYRVPIYQRHYVWEKNNWKRLWNDIEDQIDKNDVKNHFTGVIVIRADQETKIIVDGQQRLTTFQIILCAIRDICKDVGYDNIAEDADKLIRNRSRGELGILEQCKLLPTAGSDQDAFQSIVAGNAGGSGGLIYAAYIYFKTEITKCVSQDEQEMLNLFNVFLAKFCVTQLDLQPGYEAAKVFESLNGRGRTLTEFDHLRNNVFLRAGDDRSYLYETYWHHFNSTDYWFSDEVLDPFLSNFLKAKLGSKFNNKLTLFDSYQQDYRKVLQENQGLDEDDPRLIEHEFKELKRYSRVYAEINDCNQENPIWFYKFLTTKFEVTSWHPFILLLKSERADLGISEKDLELTFCIMESYIVRCILCYGPESIRRGKYLMSLINGLISLIRESDFDVSNIVAYLNDPVDENDPVDKRKWPTDPEIRNALRDVGQEKWQPRRFILYILFQIERRMTNRDFTELQLNFEKGKLSIEHVMPLSWETSIDDDSKEKLWPLPGSETEKRARKRDKWLHSIGNLTLLTGDFNKEVANLSFPTKRELYKEHSRLSLTRDIIWMPKVDPLSRPKCCKNK